MQVIAEVRRRHLVSQESISAIARDLKLSRPTVRKHLQTQNEVVYHRQVQPAPKLGEFQKTSMQLNLHRQAPTTTVM